MATDERRCRPATAGWPSQRGRGGPTWASAGQHAPSYLTVASQNACIRLRLRQIWRKQAAPPYMSAARITAAGTKGSLQRLERGQPRSVRGGGPTRKRRTLRAAIGRGNVSEVWEDGFPRHVWHRDGDVLYEARHTKGPAGSFHAYPIEEFQAPRGQLK